MGGGFKRGWQDWLQAEEDISSEELANSDGPDSNHVGLDWIDRLSRGQLDRRNSFRVHLNRTPKFLQPLFRNASREIQEREHDFGSPQPLPGIFLCLVKTHLNPFFF